VRAVRNQFEVDVSHKPQRALGAEISLVKVEDSCFAVPDVPQVVAGGVFADVRLGGFDLVIIAVDQLE
jgi:hypothetical protein